MASPRLRLSDLPPELRAKAKELRRKGEAAERARIAAHFEGSGLPRPATEYAFADESHDRKWRFDVAWVAERVALEIEGGSWGSGPECPTCGQRKAGAHTRGKHFRSDIEKYNTAAGMGWLLIRVPPEDLYALRTVEWVRTALETRGSE